MGLLIPQGTRGIELRLDKDLGSGASTPTCLAPHDPRPPASLRFRSTSRWRLGRGAPWPTWLETDGGERVRPSQATSSSSILVPHLNGKERTVTQARLHQDRSGCLRATCVPSTKFILLNSKPVKTLPQFSQSLSTWQIFTEHSLCAKFYAGCFIHLILDPVNNLKVPTWPTEKAE